jgi:hypothetical protein
LRDPKSDKPDKADKADKADKPDKPDITAFNNMISNHYLEMAANKFSSWGRIKKIMAVHTENIVAVLRKDKTNSTTPNKVMLGAFNQLDNKNLFLYYLLIKGLAIKNFSRERDRCKKDEEEEVQTVFFDTMSSLSYLFTNNQEVYAKHIVRYFYDKNDDDFLGYQQIIDFFSLASEDLHVLHII